MSKKPIPRFIEDTSEKAFQRAILWKGKASLGPKTEIEWLDIELPVDEIRKSRGHSVDIIGKLGDRYVLCELKFLNDTSKSNDPKYAMDEIVRYYESIKNNWKVLDRDDELHHEGQKAFKWKDLADDSTILMVAANSAYWAYWCGSYPFHRTISYEFPRGKKMTWCSIDVPSNLFECQRGDKDKYEPFYECTNWNILRRNWK